MISNTTVTPVANNFPKVLSFTSNRSNDSYQKRIPKPLVKTPQKEHPVALDDISFRVANKIAVDANKMGVSRTEYLMQKIKSLSYIPQVPAVPSKSAIIGNTMATTLIDGEQIFDKTVEFLKSAKESIQIEMFEFQNPKIDGHKWPSNGAETVDGYDQHANILPIILSKKKENPNLKVQIILDAHKWYINGSNEKDRHYNNMDMIKYLKENDIDVVPYPRAAQSGAALQHVKLAAVDGRKVIIGGMNWGNHSNANHDACIALETLPDKKNSEVDNLLDEIFNIDWKFSWQRLGKTKMVAGPLTEEEQEFYKGLNKEIKQENIDYMKTVGVLYDNDKDKKRYEEGRLDIIERNPVENPAIKILATKPHELSLVQEAGKETTRDYLLDKVKNSKKIRAELFVVSDKEIIQNLIQRTKSGELDAKIIVDPSIIKEFPYCNAAYQELVENGVNIREYKTDEKINQRLHSKWAVFDDREVMIGSTNWSAMGLNQNLKKGEREDYELYTDKINSEIKEYLKTVSPFEEERGLPPVNRKKIDYKELYARQKKFKKAINDINKNGEATISLQKQEYKFSEKDRPKLSTIKGYYKIMTDRNNAKEKYKRGNNEVAIAFDKPILANVFNKQFERDWKHSESDYDKIKNKYYESCETTQETGSKLDLAG